MFQPTDPIAALVGVARIGKDPLGVVIAYFAPIFKVEDIS